MTYIIWSPQGVKPPSFVFSRRWAAEKESRRLSKIHPNQVFHVCKIKSATIGGVSAYFGHWRPREKNAPKPISQDHNYWGNLVLTNPYEKKESGQLEAGGLAAIPDPDCDPFRERVTVTLPRPKKPEMDIRGFAKMPPSAPVFNASPLQEDYASLTFFRSPKVVRDSGV